MININYSSIPQKYLDYIDRFKGKIKKWYNDGEMGNGKTKIKVCHECKLIFRYLLIRDNLKVLLLLDADKLPVLIHKVEQKFPLLKKDRLDKPKPRSELYQCLNKAFYSLGYCDQEFPDFEITSSLGLRACPYCNAEEIIVQDLKDEGVHIRNSELDHFYPRELYPFLAISLYNLVPSGSICNQGSCKHNKDSLVEGLVNPFELQDPDGLLFELVIENKDLLSYRLQLFKRSCSIKMHVINARLEANARIFLIEPRYSKELEQAWKVWWKYKKYASNGYRNMADRISDQLDVNLTYEEWFEMELDIRPNNYNYRKLSKLSMDIWRQLEQMNI